MHFFFLENKAEVFQLMMEILKIGILGKIQEKNATFLVKPGDLALLSVFIGKKAKGQEINFK